MNEELVDVLLGLRHSVSLDIEGYRNATAKLALSDVVTKIDSYLVEHTRVKKEN
jgi:hypothetical protein